MSGTYLLVLGDNDDHKGPGLGYRTTRGSRFLFLELGCGQIHPVPLRVDVHGFGADWSCHRLLDLELAGRRLPRNLKLAVAAEAGGGPRAVPLSLARRPGDRRTS